MSAAWATSIMPALYRRFSGREPDASGSAYWTQLAASHPEWSDAELTAKWMASAATVLEAERISGVAVPQIYARVPIPTSATAAGGFRLTMPMLLLAVGAIFLLRR